MDIDVYEKRAAHLQQLMEKSNLDFVITCDPANVYYLGGFWGYAASFRPVFLCVSSEGELAMLTPKIEHEYARLSSWIERIDYYIEWPEPGSAQSPEELLVTTLRDMGMNSKCRLGFESKLSSGTLLALDGAFGRDALATADELFGKLRMIKDPNEIETMRKLGQVIIASVEAAMSEIHSGVSEYEVSIAAQQAAERKAAEFLGEQSLMSPMVSGIQMFQSGIETSIVHGRASTRIIQQNELIMLCFCEYAQFNGYHGGFTRMARTGELPAKQIKIIEAASLAQEEALKMMRPGVEAREVDRAARRSIVESGFGDYICHRTGRGLGTSAVEKPELRESDATRLAPGMVVTVEPAIYVPGVGGARLEDIILITGNGHESLTPYPKEIHLNV